MWCYVCLRLRLNASAGRWDGPSSLAAVHAVRVGSRALGLGAGQVYSRVNGPMPVGKPLHVPYMLLPSAVFCCGVQIRAHPAQRNPTHHGE